MRNGVFYSVVMLLLPVMVVGGCQASSATQVATLRQGHTLVINTASALIEQKKLSKAQALEFNKAQEVVDLSIAILEIKVQNKSVVTVEEVQKVQNALDELQQIFGGVK